MHWLIDEEFRRCVGGDGDGDGDGGDVGDARSDSSPELIKPGSRANGAGSLTLVDGGRAALERELLWLVALGNAGTPRAIDLQRMLSARRPGLLRFVGQIGHATGADAAELSSDR